MARAAMEAERMIQNSTQPHRKPASRPYPRQKNVVAAGFGIEDCYFRQGQAAEKRQRAAQNPDQGRQSRVGNVLGDDLWFFEDARADNSSHDHGRGGQRTESAKQTGTRSCR